MLEWTGLLGGFSSIEDGECNSFGVVYAVGADLEFDGALSVVDVDALKMKVASVKSSDRPTG